MATNQLDPALLEAPPAQESGPSAACAGSVSTPWPSTPHWP